MNMTDPIADMLTRIRNAATAKHDTVQMPASKVKLAIAPDCRLVMLIHPFLTHLNGLLRRYCELDVRLWFEARGNGGLGVRCQCGSCSLECLELPGEVVLVERFVRREPLGLNRGSLRILREEAG